MRPYSQMEIDQHAKALYSRMVGGHSLLNAEKVVKGVGKLLKVEKQRRKAMKKQ